MSEAKNHHYVPQFLLRQWLVTRNDNRVLAAYYLDAKSKQLRCHNTKSTQSFCSEDYLLTLEKSPIDKNGKSLGKDAIERHFFGRIDDFASRSINKILESKANIRNSEIRSHIARFLISLELRRPESLSAFRQAATELGAELNADPAIITSAKALGIQMRPTEYIEDIQRVSLHDNMLSVIQDAVNDKNVGTKLINLSWDVRQIADKNINFVLSDRPLIRIGSLESSSTFWALPLNPQTLIYAVKTAKNLGQIRNLSDLQLARHCNRSSCIQAEKYVFSSDEANEKWLVKYLAASVLNQ